MNIIPFILDQTWLRWKGFSNTSQSKRHDDIDEDWIHVAQNKVQRWAIVDVPLIP